MKVFDEPGARQALPGHGDGTPYPAPERDAAVLGRDDEPGMMGISKCAAAACRGDVVRPPG